MTLKHTPVMLEECINSLKIKKNGIYLDLTLGRAGHSSEILKNITSGQLISFDKDINAINDSKEKLKNISNNFQLIHSDFRFLNQKLSEIEIKLVDGILIDLGVSSPQIDDEKRGFSYNKNAKLDMRMNQSQDFDAYQLVNEYSFEQIRNILYNYGDIKLSSKIAKAIIEKRPITTTIELVEVIKQSLPAAVLRKKNPAKAVFQALRMEVNDEVNSLKDVLTQAIESLNINGTLCVITFHSIEDRIVKNFFKNLIEKKHHNKMPVIEKMQWTVKTIKPSKEEIAINNRSRSAKLRVLTRNF